MWKIRLQSSLSLGTFYLFILLLVACDENQHKKNQNLKIFKYNRTSGVSSTDPAFAKDQSNIWCVNHLYTGLLQLDNQLNVVPSIAKSWTISPDGLQYTFTLREDVKFMDDDCFENGKGRRVLATDIEYSFTRLINPTLASPGAWIFNGKVADKNPFKALNDNTFQLTLKTPFPPMLSMLTMQYAFIVPKEAVEKYGVEFRNHPVGSGPFKLKTWEEGNSMYLVKNENYYEMEGHTRLPYLDGVKISFIDNKKTEFLSFKEGNLHFISGIDASYIDEVLNDDGSLKDIYKGKFMLMKCAYLNTEYLGFLMNNKGLKALQNKQIRQAINYGFDRNSIITYLRNTVGKPATAGFIPVGLPCFDATKVQGYSYDIEKSKALLIQAGFPGGEGLEPIILYTNESYKDVAEYISKELSKIGLVVRVELTPPALLREWMSQEKAGFFRGSWIADYPDGESYLCMFYSKNTAPPNYTRFSNVAYDKLYEAALLENNIEKRYELYHQMEQIIIDEAPVVPLYYDEVLRFTRNNVKGLEPNALNLLDLRRVKLD